MAAQNEVESAKEISNKVLFALAADKYARIAPDLTLIHLTKGDQLYRTGNACRLLGFS